MLPTLPVLSAISRTHADARSFVARGIDVMSVPEFIRGFVGQPVTAQMHSHPGKCLCPEDMWSYEFCNKKYG